MSKRSRSWCDVVSFIFITMILMSVICLNDYENNPDVRFLYNRVVQMVACFRDGKLPFFYYGDFGGVGYGTSFFYGQLTLLPFLCLVGQGIRVWAKAFLIVSLWLNYRGCCCLARRYSGNGKEISLLWIGSTYFVFGSVGYGTYANLYALGISLFYLGYLIDFLRDKKSGVSAALIYFLVFHTHLVTALICFFMTIFLFLCYYDSRRWKDYLGFAGLTTIFCFYQISNMLYHADILNNTININKRMLEMHNASDNYMNYGSWIPFGGLFFSLIFQSLSNNGYKLCNWVVLILCFCCFIFRYRGRRVSKREYFGIGIVVIGVLSGVNGVWYLINQVWLVPIQFPIRYIPYLIIAMLIIGFRDVSKNKVWVIGVISCLPELLLGWVFISPISEDVKTIATDLYCQVENGEYLDKSFIWDTNTFQILSHQVCDSNGNLYSYGEEKGVLYVDLSSCKDRDHLVLQLPKLYYRGYWCNAGDVRKGYSQFIEVGITDFTEDILILEYRHPVWLIILMLSSYTLALIFFLFSMYRWIYSIKRNN